MKKRFRSIHGCQQRLTVEYLERRFLLAADFLGSPLLEYDTRPHELRGVRGVASADIDSDGDTDVIIGSSADNTIAWYENTSSGAMVPRTVISDENSSLSVDAADLDGDGDTDIAAGLANGSAVVWYTNDGNELFTEQVVASRDEDGLVDVALKDMDFDGDVDILAGLGRLGKILWYENDGQGIFSEREITSGVDGVNQVRAEDVDNDGDIDVVHTAKTTNTVAWHENDGSMQFEQHIITEDAFQVVDVIVNDVDRDGDVDIVISEQKQVLIHRNDGNQAFVPEFLANHSDARLVIGDVDIDQDDDILAVERGGAVFWHENVGVGYISHPVGGVGRSPELTLADSDEDNRPELSIVTSESISYYEFAPGPLRPLGPIDSNGDFVQVDVDADGDKDLVGGQHFLYWYENENTAEWKQTKISDCCLRSVNESDVDRDGDMDVVAGFTNGEIHWYEVDGSGTFVAHFVGKVEHPTRSVSITDVHFADADNDGDSDAVATTSNGRVVWFLNDGDEQFDDTADVHIFEQHASYAFAADFNGDTNMDVLTVTDYDSIVLNVSEGDGLYEQRLLATAVGQWMEPTQTVDFDNDGDLDIVTILDGQLVWFENNGEAFFSQHVIATDAPLGFFFAHDGDQDGDIDVISTSNGATLWHENNGSQVFTTTLVSWVGPSQVLPNDVDMDGNLDIVGLYFNTITWTRNGRVRPSRGDFNQNGRHDCADVTLLIQRSNNGPYAESFDLNGDAILDTHDVNAWLLEAANEKLGIDQAFAKGDVNLDGVVDQMDLNEVAKNWRNQVDGGWCDGDFDVDGLVSSPDLNQVGSHWLNTIIPTQVARRVPRAPLHQRRNITENPTIHDVAVVQTEALVDDPSTRCVDDSASLVFAAIRRRWKMTSTRRFDDGTSRINQEVTSSAQRLGIDCSLVEDAIAVIQLTARRL